MTRLEPISKKNSRLILGIGNPIRGDDGAGNQVIRRLQLMPPRGWDLAEADAEPSKLMDLWTGYREVIAVDAVFTETGETGTIYQWNVIKESLPRDKGISSSHGLGLAESIELARALDRLPESFLVFGIEGRCFELDAPFSPGVDKAIETITQALVTKGDDYA